MCVWTRVWWNRVTPCAVTLLASFPEDEFIFKHWHWCSMGMLQAIVRPGWSKWLSSSSTPTATRRPASQPIAEQKTCVRW